MDVKKKKSLILVVIMILSILVGCTNEQASFLDELKQVGAWEATSFKVAMDMTLNEGKEKLNIKIEANTLLNTKDQTAYIDMVIKCNAFNYDIPIKMYIDNQKIYMNKEYFKALALIDGSSVSKINKLSAQYIILDANETSEWSRLINQALTVVNSNPTNFTYTLIQDISTDIGSYVPVTKENNTYIVNLSSDQFLDLIVNIVDTSLSNLNKLNVTYKLGIPQLIVARITEDYKQIKKFEEPWAAIKNDIRGSYFNMTYAFEEDRAKETANMVISIPDEAINMSLNISAEMDKEDPEAIQMPQNAVTMSYDDISELFTPYTITVDIKSGTYTSIDDTTKQIKTIIEKDKVYLPLKQILSEFEGQVSYDPQSKKIYAILNKETVTFNTLTKNGVAYVSTDELFSKKYFKGYFFDDNIIEIWTTN